MILPAFARKTAILLSKDFRNIISNPGKYGIPDATPPGSGGGAIPLYTMAAARYNALLLSRHFKTTCDV